MSRGLLLRVACVATLGSFALMQFNSVAVMRCFHVWERCWKCGYTPDRFRWNAVLHTCFFDMKCGPGKFSKTVSSYLLNVTCSYETFHYFCSESTNIAVENDKFLIYDLRKQKIVSLKEFLELKLVNRWCDYWIFRRMHENLKYFRMPMRRWYAVCRQQRMKKFQKDYEGDILGQLWHLPIRSL